MLAAEPGADRAAFVGADLVSALLSLPKGARSAATAWGALPWPAFGRRGGDKLRPYECGACAPGPAAVVLRHEGGDKPRPYDCSTTALNYAPHAQSPKIALAMMFFWISFEPP